MTSTCWSGGRAARSREILWLAANPKLPGSRRRRAILRFTGHTNAGRSPFTNHLFSLTYRLAPGTQCPPRRGTGHSVPSRPPGYARGARCTKSPHLWGSLLKYWRDPDGGILARGCLPQVRAHGASTAELGAPAPDSGGEVLYLLRPDRLPDPDQAARGKKILPQKKFFFLAAWRYSG